MRSSMDLGPLIQPDAFPNREVFIPCTKKNWTSVGVVDNSATAERQFTLFAPEELIQAGHEAEYQPIEVLGFVYPNTTLHTIRMMLVPWILDLGRHISCAVFGCEATHSPGSGMTFSDYQNVMDNIFAVANNKDRGCVAHTQDDLVPVI
jgi:hypothetical protein